MFVDVAAQNRRLAEKAAENVTLEQADEKDRLVVRRKGRSGDPEVTLMTRHQSQTFFEYLSEWYEVINPIVTG